MRQVVIHVYDVSRAEAIAQLNDVTCVVGGVFHAGVEIYGREWSFGYRVEPGVTGVYSIEPRSCPGHVWRESIRLGECALDERAARAAIAALEPRWPGEGYDLIRRNCAHFCDDVCDALGVEQPPRWLNRFARGAASASDGAAAAAEHARALADEYGVSESAADLADAWCTMSLFPEWPADGTAPPREPRSRPPAPPSFTSWLMGDT